MLPKKSLIFSKFSISKIKLFFCIEGFKIFSSPLLLFIILFIVILLFLTLFILLIFFSGIDVAEILEISEILYSLVYFHYNNFLF